MDISSVVPFEVKDWVHVVVTFIELEESLERPVHLVVHESVEDPGRLSLHRAVDSSLVFHNGSWDDLELREKVDLDLPSVVLPPPHSVDQGDHDMILFVSSLTHTLNFDSWSDQLKD